MIRLQNSEILYQTFIQRLRLFAELLLYLLPDLIDRCPSVNLLPDKTSELLHLDMADLGPAECHLGNTVEDSAVLHIDGHHSILIRLPGQRRVAVRYKFQIISFFLFRHKIISSQTFCLRTPPD